MTYKDEVIKAMELLARDKRTLFLGQSVTFPGSVVFGTLGTIDNSKKIELPIMEEAQAGMAIGLSLKGYVPVSIYPRMDFMWRAADQLVNHLDKIDEMSDGKFKPKVIIRTLVGSKTPFYPGLQHCSDYTDVFKLLFKNIDVVKLEKKEDIIPAYEKALKSNKSTILIEISDLYNSE